MKTFCISRKIYYEEIESTSPYYNKFYLIENPYREKIVAIPDGCVDLQFVWQGDEIEMHICGSFLKGGITQTSNYDRCFGIKLNNGVIPRIRDDRISELENKKINIKELNMKEIVGKRYKVEAEILSNELMQKIERQHRLRKYSQIFRKNSSMLEYEVEHGITNYALEEIKNSFGNISMISLIRRLGYSQCYIERLFKSTMGISLKKYANIIRFQYAIEALEKNKDHVDYETLGYYDQAHFIKEFKYFTLWTPCSYMEQREQMIV